MPFNRSKVTVKAMPHGFVLHLLQDILHEKHPELRDCHEDADAYAKRLEPVDFRFEHAIAFNVPRAIRHRESADLGDKKLEQRSDVGV